MDDPDKSNQDFAICLSAALRQRSCSMGNPKTNGRMPFHKSNIRVNIGAERERGWPMPRRERQVFYIVSPGHGP